MTRVTKRVRILVADDHQLVRRGIREILRARRGCTVVGEATNGREAVEKENKLKPYVTVLDISGPILPKLLIAIKDQVFVRGFQGKRLAQLLDGPTAGRMPRDVNVQDAPPIMTDAQPLEAVRVRKAVYPGLLKVEILVELPEPEDLWGNLPTRVPSRSTSDAGCPA
jgi:CheY-like chemotaxis protein